MWWWLRKRCAGKLALLIFLSASVTGYTLDCPDRTWEKIRGMRPENTKSIEHLHTGVDSQGITTTCFEKCRSSNCSAFIVDLEKSGCFTVEPIGEELVPEPNVTFFQEICLKVPESCLKTRYWQVERNLGSVLIDYAAKILPRSVTRSECYEACIKNEKECKSAQFRTSQDLQIGDTVGSCAILTIERGTKPQAYRASLYRDEYLENQCHDISQSDYSSYAEYQNVTMPYSDLKIDGLSAKQCEQRCDDSNDGFLCRAYGIEYSNSNTSTCFLHSENTITAGVSSLVTSPNSFYKERDFFIDTRLRCTNTSLMVELHTTEPFVGRMYANGYSETCGTQGQGDNVTTLILPLPDLKNIDDSDMPCGLTPAYSIDPDNQTRTMIWSIVVIQFNPIIQRLGDQRIKVGCYLGGVPEPQNITVSSGYAFIDPNAGLPPIVTTVTNTSSQVPIVTMSILDEFMRPAVVTNLGQRLFVKIQITPKDGDLGAIVSVASRSISVTLRLSDEFDNKRVPNINNYKNYNFLGLLKGPFDMTAGHLIASTSSGDSSLILLDSMGCPVSEIFPSLMKDPTDNSSLIAEFNAFKFPGSQFVQFRGVVKFCLEVCEPSICNNNTISYGRRRRSTNSLYPTEANVTELYKSLNNNTADILPVQATFIVQDKRDNQNISPDPLRSKDFPDTVIRGSEFCMDASLALALLIFLLIIQIILIGSCVLAVRTYRRLAIRAEEDRADILARHLYGIHGGNFEISRRVRWADNSGSTLS